MGGRSGSTARRGPDTGGARQARRRRRARRHKLLVECVLVLTTLVVALAPIPGR